MNNNEIDRLDFRVKNIPDKKDFECTHKFWIKRCSLCREILESDSKVNSVSGKCHKVIYRELSPLVVRYDIIKFMVGKGINMQSTMSWIVNPEGIVTLRSDVANYGVLDGFSVLPAPTSSEISKMFRKYPANIVNKYWDKIGKNSHKPDSIARILIRIHFQSKKDKRLSA